MGMLEKVAGMKKSRWPLAMCLKNGLVGELVIEVKRLKNIFYGHV